MSKNFVDSSFEDAANSALEAFKSGDDSVSEGSQIDDEHYAHAQRASDEEWTTEMAFQNFEGVEEDEDEEEPLSEDEGYSEEKSLDSDEELEEGSDEEAVGDLEEEQEESSSKEELPPTEVIKANGQRTVIDYDMSNPRTRQKYKTAVQMAAAYKTYHGKESVLRNELKDEDLSFLKVEDPYSKEGMKRIGLAVKGMGKLTELANSGDIVELFKTITRSEENPDGIDPYQWVESQQQATVDYENMSDAEKRAYDLQLELKEQKKELARLRQIEERKAEQLEAEKLSVKQQERANQVVPVWRQLRVRPEDVGGSAKAARNINKAIWGEVAEFCKGYEKETGSLPDESTLAKFINSEIKETIGYRKTEEKKAVKKQKVAKKAKAKSSAAKAVKQPASKPLKSLDVSDIASQIESFFG